ncbi:cell envelope integrity protein TolA [Pseudothauera rhizosphaerae]|uniref:Cell envelope integrity protein TolA n=1 Tax=Pseudothauera rhizosphaerae TaxID=2565932 RepID=A0A4S4AHF1_9RHOO|nr:cell envelope integrity protein TolA [Pseudothauera rhizosphaerae]
MPGWVSLAAGIVLLLVLLGALLWYLLFNDTATTKRPVADTPMLMLPPPPPPPEPEPEPEPTPEPEPEEPMPEPEPLEEAPKPAEEEAPTPDTSDPVTMDADAQAGTDSWGIQKGSGGGSIGTGGSGAGNASYGRYLGYLLQQAIARDDRVRRLTFQLLLNVWLEQDGTISRVELVRGSGNDEADEAVLDAVRSYGRVDERPPASLAFPARVLVQGRRPSS